MKSRGATLERHIAPFAVELAKVYARFPGVPKMADFCTHWFRLAHDALPPGGRAGLVGTNTSRQNESREASLD